MANVIKSHVFKADTASVIVDPKSPSAGQIEIWTDDGHAFHFVASRPTIERLGHLISAALAQAPLPARRLKASSKAKTPNKSRKSI